MTSRSVIGGGVALALLVALASSRRSGGGGARGGGSTRGGGAPLVQVPATSTPLDRGQAARFLSVAYLDTAGRRPTAPELSMLLAQSAVETGGWRKMRRWNYGMITTSSGEFFRLVNDPKHRYAVYESPEAGAGAFVGLLARRYPEAWAALGSNSVRAYAYALKSAGYYEAEPGSYADALGSWYPGFLRFVAEVGRGNA